MVNAFRRIDKISTHPAPWPYTHLTQFFLVLWVYSLPIVLVDLYQVASFFIMAGITIILFGMDSVAREIQDPFGFDANDLNVHGYENDLIRDVVRFPTLRATAVRNV